MAASLGNALAQPDHASIVFLDDLDVFGQEPVRIEQEPQLGDVPVLPHAGLDVGDQVDYVLRPVLTRADLFDRRSFRNEPVGLQRLLT